MIRANELLEKIEAYLPKADLAPVQQAYVLMASSHGGQMRRSGEPYLIHPLEVASMLADLHMDIDTIAAGLLHDTVEDTGLTSEEIERSFGSDVAFLVAGVTKISKTQLAFSTREAEQAENFRKILMAMGQDIRVIIIKLLDRLHNMRTLEHLSEEARIRNSRETLDLYAPIARRLGLTRIASELGDLAFKYLNPTEYRRIAESLGQNKSEREEVIDKVTAIIGKKIGDTGIDAVVAGRTKTIYSIYRKMIDKGMTLQAIHDIYGYRVLVDSVEDCYRTLGIIHTTFKPIPGRFKDYIALPKPNGYQSLHTAVIGPLGNQAEIQIRTSDMHRVAEYGVASHWLYKDVDGETQDGVNQGYKVVRQLLELQQTSASSEEFVEHVRVDLFPGETYVFTPKGEVKSLPRGATPVDLAYSIHTDIGHACVGAKINGRFFALDTILSNGDQVEILTGPRAKPQRRWLRFVVSARARSAIRYWFRKQEHEEAIEIGRVLLDQVLHRFDHTLDELIEDEIQILLDHWRFSMDELCYRVGMQRVTPLDALVPLIKEKGWPHRKERGVRRPLGIARMDGALIRLASCCMPVHGDPLVGLIQEGRLVVEVHHRECPRVRALSDPGVHCLEVNWAPKGEEVYTARMRLIAQDRPGMLASITNAVAELGINIRESRTANRVGRIAELIFSVQVHDAGQIEELIARLRYLEGVQEISRLFKTEEEEDPDRQNDLLAEEALGKGLKSPSQSAIQETPHE